MAIIVWGPCRWRCAIKCRLSPRQEPWRRSSDSDKRDFPDSSLSRPATKPGLGAFGVRSLSPPTIAAEPCGFRVEVKGGKCLVYATDTGSITADVRERLLWCIAAW